MRAVFDSWNTDRARLYRRQEQIPRTSAPRSTSRPWSSATAARPRAQGCASPATRRPAVRGVYGDYLADAQGEDVVAGIRNTVPLTDLAELDRASYDQLLEVMSTLERHYRDLCDIEFTIEDGRLWVLQTRVGKRTPEAAFRIAADMVADGVIDLDEALPRVTGAQLAALMFPRFDPDAARVLAHPRHERLAGRRGRPVVFDSATAAEWAARGEDVVLVREETDPDDLPGLIAARGVLTSRGGRTSHAAVVARGLGRTCVCGADALEVDADGRRLTVRGGSALVEGDLISLDGSTGEVFARRRAGRRLACRALVRGRRRSTTTSWPPWPCSRSRRPRAGWRAGQRRHPGGRRPGPSVRRRRIGLCRTEHMFLGERRPLVERLIVADDDAERDAALTRCCPCSARTSSAS